MFSLIAITYDIFFNWSLLLEKKIFPYVFEKLPQQILSIFHGGRNQHVTVKEIQDEKGIWKIDLVSHPLVIKFLTRQNDGPGDIQVCTLCHIGYFAVSGGLCNRGFIFISNYNHDQLLMNISSDNTTNSSINPLAGTGGSMDNSILLISLLVNGRSHVIR